MLRLEKDPREIEAVNALFRAFHTIKGVSVHLDLTEISTLAHEAENLLDQIREGERKWDVQSVEAVFQAADGMRRLFEKLSSAVASGTCVESDPHLPELLSLIRSLSEADGDDASREEGEEGATAPPTGAPAAKRSPAGGPASRHVKKVREFVRVDAERLDHLVETVGELVTAVSVMEQSLISGAGDSLESSQKEVKKIARELQELGTSLRMVPLRSTFQKMTRLVRDLARQAGKGVDMQVSGEDTELDKTMVEKLGDPLLHLLRNAVDHGIESSAGERGLLGKPERGTIELRAYHQGGNICIEVEDDGRGLRRERILEQARKAGLVAEGEDPGDNDLYKLVFEAGFSTAETVTSLSGRGVGLDVVRRNIEDLRGSISLSSEPGFGTLFTISLPLTIAIIDGMVVRVGEERYIVPTLSVVRSVRPEENELTAVLDREQVINVQDALVPFCRLSDLFEIDGAVHDPTDGLVLVVHHLGKQYGFLVDEVLGQQQVVIKNLGTGIRSVQGIGGGAVMADGRVGLILDVAGLVDLARTRGRQALRCAV